LAVDAPCDAGVLRWQVETLELKNTRLETLCRTLQAQLKAKDAPATAAADTGASDE
jgi:hypothetical protein